MKLKNLICSSKVLFLVNAYSFFSTAMAQSAPKGNLFIIGGGDRSASMMKKW